MAYIQIEKNLIDYLTGETEAPDSVLEDKLERSLFVIGAMREFEDMSPLANGLQVVVRLSSGQANPKWLRDLWFVTFQVIGQDRSKYVEAEQLIQEVFNTFLGSDTLYLGDRAYVQFNSQEMPRFAGYFEDSKPLFSTTINFVVEGLEDKHNRKALC